jgi:hypothetical protein
MTDIEQMEMDRGATLGDFQAALLSIAAGDAPSVKLRVLALRAYRNQNVQGTALCNVEPTSEERAELERLNGIARRRH